eukprot:14088744-Ditylum_brightwellii.AAC.1
MKYPSFVVGTIANASYGGDAFVPRSMISGHDDSEYISPIVNVKENESTDDMVVNSDESDDFIAKQEEKA